MHWKILSTRTRHVAELKLPSFDSFWAVPAFAWPYVAYVEIGKPLGQTQRIIHCVLYDYRKKSVVERQRQLLSESAFGTDFPHMFTPPVVTTNGGATNFAFGFDDAGKHKVICRLQAP